MNGESTRVVAAAVQLFLANRSASEGELVTKMSAEFRDLDVAERLVAFVPLAFGRVILERIGVQLPDRFVRMRADGTFTAECPLNWEPLWLPALDFAHKAEMHLARDDFLAIASRSAEFDAVNNACHAGSNPKDLVAAVPIFMREEPLPPAPRKRWWRLRE